jgi:hypothetical protein
MKPRSGEFGFSVSRAASTTHTIARLNDSPRQIMLRTSPLRSLNHSARKNSAAASGPSTIARQFIRIRRR